VKFGDTNGRVSAEQAEEGAGGTRRGDPNRARERARRRPVCREFRAPGIDLLLKLRFLLPDDEDLDRVMARVRRAVMSYVPKIETYVNGKWRAGRGDILLDRRRAIGCESSK
jgi:hypothetical protein